jgi:hypothetical protein
MLRDLLDDILADLIDWPGGRSIDEPRDSDVFEPTTLSALSDAWGSDPEVARLVRRSTTDDWTKADAARLYAAVVRLAGDSSRDPFWDQLQRRQRRSAAAKKSNTTRNEPEHVRVLARYDALRAAGLSCRDAISKLHREKNRRDVYRRWIKARAP